jgi:DNA helicase-4
LGLLRAAGCEEALTEQQLDAVVPFGADLEVLVASANERIVAAELSSRRAFFGAIEKSPLTDEQARAVVCFDNRVPVLAGARPGKTSGDGGPGSLRRET